MSEHQLNGWKSSYMMAMSSEQMREACPFLSTSSGHNPRAIQFTDTFRECRHIHMKFCLRKQPIFQPWDGGGKKEEKCRRNPVIETGISSTLKKHVTTTPIPLVAARRKSSIYVPLTSCYPSCSSPKERVGNTSNAWENIFKLKVVEIKLNAISRSADLTSLPS